MKKLLQVFLIIALAALLYFQFVTRRQSSKMILSPIANILNSTPQSTPLAVSVNDQSYEVAFVAANSDKISLYSNLEDKLSSNDLIKAKSCQALINAGFYTKEDKPTGLLISEGKTIEYYKRSQLFNGIYSITFDNKARIAATFPQGSTRFAIQSGPLLLVDHNYQKLTIKNDEPARRSAAALASTGQTYFFSIYNKNSNYAGPNLADLPAVLQKIENELAVDFTDAINLDGGTASAFFSDQFAISELSYIGSYFCIK